MDSEVVRSQVHESDEHQQEEQNSEVEKKSVLNKVKAKAKKIKDTIKKHGQYVLDPAHEEDQQVDGTPVDESEAVKSVPPTFKQVEDFVKTATPALEKVENFDELGVNSGGDKTRVILGASPTTETHQSIATTEPTKAFDEEKKPKHFNVNLIKPTGWDEDPCKPEGESEAFTTPNYQTKVSDPTGTGADEIDIITPVEKSFERMNVQDGEPEPNPEPKVLSYLAETRYPSDGRQGGFVPKLDPEISSETKTQYPSSAGSNDKIVPEITTETETETESVGKEQEKGDVSVKDYLAEKLKPGEEDKALSEVISEALQNKPKEEEAVSEESYVNIHSPGKRVVRKIKGVVGSWFGKENQSSSPQVAGGDDLPKNKNAGDVEGEQISEGGGEKRLQE